MKILLASERYKPSANGVATSVANLEDALRRQGHDVKVLTVSESLETIETENVIALGSYSVEKIYPDARLRRWGRREHIRKLIDWKPDIIHTNTEFSTFNIAKFISRETGAPILHTYHTDYENYTRYIHLKGKVGRLFVKHFLLYMQTYLTCIIAPSEKTQQILSRYTLSVPVEVVPTGLDLSKYEKDIPSGELDKLRERFHIPKDKPALLILGRIGREKNISEILDNLSSFKQQDFTLLIVGDGPAKAEIAKEVEEKGLSENTIFTGLVPQTEVENYYHLASLFLSASKSETQGLTYIESLASALPVLCKKDSCLKNVVVEGRNGFLFENKAEFQAKLNAFLSDENLRKAMSENAKEDSKKYSSDVFAERVLSLYAKALKAPKKKRGNLIKRTWHKLFCRFPLI